MISPRGRSLIILMVIFDVLTLTFLALRFYTLFRIKQRSYRPDDFIIVISTASLLAMEGAVFWAIHNGLGFHTATLPWSDVAIQIRMQTSTLFTWTISTCTCKLALLFLYLDIFRIHVTLRKAIWLLVILTSCYAPVFIPFFMTQCSPVSAAWDPVLSKTNCRSLKIQELASVAVNLFLDTAIVVAPLPVVWQLKMPTTKKIGVSAIFGLGIAVIGVMIWRLISTTSPTHNQDIVYELYTVSVQAQLECWLGNLAANLPTLGPLLNKMSGSKVAKYIISSLKAKSTDHGSASERGLPLRTFGGSGKPTRPGGHGDFHLLYDEGDGLNTQHGIMLNWEVRVSTETSTHRSAANGHKSTVETQSQ
ncbi:uncharacterized protein F4822DRAFT_421849 [Hypoxylon trugodes]|uniref:uncharacterized protein n=1 Tax=Hypoxylon trugodes TaxID=326681 RepID=UPI0021A08F15|nr:uncharacterized protein F4822DRAFT_421849 [Hypoxylon trugodes]KAI1383022.1 hypothetical protein F4822DRAFT_421849 [Hypoxylon trugodes]